MLGFEKTFSGRSAQRRVAEYLFKKGIRVSENGKLLAGDLEISQVSVSRVLELDRRVVKSTINSITEDDYLSGLFKNISITPSLKEIAPALGYGAIEIIPDDAAGKGIVAGVTECISSIDIGIRQVIADDPTFDNPQLTVITEKPIPRNLIDKILKIEGVKKVVVLN